MTARHQRQRKYTAKEGASRTGISERHVRRLVALPRDEWLAEKAAERESIRAFHDEQGHSWTQTAAHFGLHVDTVKRRAYTARKERAAEREEAERKARKADEPPLFEAS
jgi:hypothetical protein